MKYLAFLAILIAGMTVSPTLAETPLRTQFQAPVRLLPELVPVCKCESGLKHTHKNGIVVRGRVNNRDIGLCQINEDFHGDTAEEMGLELWKYQDNIRYANHLFRTQGYQPWEASKSCWKNVVN